MENVSNLMNIEGMKNALDVKMENEFARIKKNTETHKMFLDKLNVLMPTLVKTLKEQNLEITSISARKTGDTPDWNPENCLFVNLSLKPTSDKFKFIKFAGYTSKGSGKNQEQLNNRASKLSEAIKLGTGLPNVSVNQYSFEIDKNNDDVSNKTILVEFWVR